MSFLELAAKIQSEIQKLPLETIGYQALDAKHHGSDRIQCLLQKWGQDLSQEIQNRTRAEFLALGPLEKLVKDEEVTEILINSKDNIWFEKSGRLYQHEDSFFSELTFTNFINRLIAETQSIINVDQPFADSKFRGFRLHIGGYGPHYNQFVISLRKQRQTPWSFDRLQEKSWAPSECIHLLRRIVFEKKNILVVGDTGSGKTSVLSALLSELPSAERCLILEDTDELHCPNRSSTKLLSRSQSKNHSDQSSVTLSDLIVQALRMRPDRLIVGEVRGSETKDLLLALSTGHQGSMGTLHAANAKQALLRLEMLIQMGAPQWSTNTIRQLIGLSLHYIVVVGKSRSGHRLLKSIHEIGSVEESGILLDCHFQDIQN